MKIHIEFCIKWNYGPEFDRVSKIVNEINKDINVQGNRKSPRSGAFEVIIEDKLVFSKFKINRFPTLEEIKEWIE